MMSRIVCIVSAPELLIKNQASKEIDHLKNKLQDLTTAKDPEPGVDALVATVKTKKATPKIIVSLVEKSKGLVASLSISKARKWHRQYGASSCGWGNS